MKPLVQQLDQLIPGFESYAFDDDENLFLQDGELTAHGAFSAFSTYFREKSRSLEPDQLAGIGRVVNQIVGGPDKDLDNAACTCFLENLAGDYPQLESELLGDARRYWDAWK